HRTPHHPQLRSYPTRRSSDLTLKEAQLLELLMKRKNMIISKEMMIEKVWGFDTDADESRVVIHISLLRKKLTKLGSSVTIRTIRSEEHTSELQSRFDLVCRLL